MKPERTCEPSDAWISLHTLSESAGWTAKPAVASMAAAALAAVLTAAPPFFLGLPPAFLYSFRVLQCFHSQLSPALQLPMLLSQGWWNLHAISALGRAVEEAALELEDPSELAFSCGQFGRM